MVPKINIYKVAISPLSEDAPDKRPHFKRVDPIVSNVSNLGKDRADGVTMLQYDDHLKDLVPVNTKKLDRIYPDLPPIRGRVSKKASIYKSKDRHYHLYD